MAGYAMLQNTTKVDLQKSLAELTAAMQQLATKDQLVDQGTSTQPGPAGSGQETGSDTKVLVDFEKVTVDTYRITNGGQELPLVPGNIRNMLRDFTFGDLRDLLSIFGNLEALTSPAFHRTLESYGLAIKKLQHEKILSAEDVNATTIYNLEAGPEISGFILHVPMAQAAIGGQVLGVRQDWLPHAQDEGHGHDSGGFISEKRLSIASFSSCTLSTFAANLTRLEDSLPLSQPEPVRREGSTWIFHLTHP